MHQHRQNHNKILLETICYSDIFDYPLSRDNIMRFIIGEKLNKESIEKSLLTLLTRKKISRKKGYYFLKGRKKIVDIFKEKEIINIKKNAKAKKIISILQHIPTVMLIGISGSLAMENAKESDDIDLFIISKSNTIWTTRFLVVLVLQILGVKRGRKSLRAKNRICANMFLDESNLTLPLTKQNLYTAHEVLQMKPVFIRDNMYQKFLFKNIWVKKFLPQSVKIENQKIVYNKTSNFYINALPVVEAFIKSLQKIYMKKHRTSELITPTMLAFHPNDMQETVLSKFAKRIKKYAV